MEDILGDISSESEGEYERRQQEKVQNSINRKQKEAFCDHPELYHSMCSKCSVKVSDQEMFNHYREYALLGLGKNKLIKQSYADKYVKSAIEKHFAARKLVLILDLDNTLIHTKDCGRVESGQKTEFKLIDEANQVYSAKMHPWKYHIKCRPFLVEFLLGVMPKYEIFFYTAGIRIYGLLILDVIKSLIQDQVKERDDKEFKEFISQSFKGERLIARDDQERFQSQKEQIQMEQKFGFTVATSAGGDSTLKMKNVFKSLKSLTGGNDRIFVVLDDREDPWYEEEGGIPLNVLRIPAYFFFTKDQQKRFSYQELMQDIARETNLDLTLMTYQRHLIRIHDAFFRNFDAKSKNGVHEGVLTDVKHYIPRTKQQIFDQNFIVAFPHFVRFEDDKFIRPEFEIQKCKEFNLAYVREYTKSEHFALPVLPESCEQDLLVIVPDQIDGKQIQAIKDSIKDCRIISIYWLYLSSELLFQLPLEPFEKYEDEWSNEDSEKLRVQKMLEESFEKTVEAGGYVQFKERHEIQQKLLSKLREQNAKVALGKKRQRVEDFGEEEENGQEKEKETNKEEEELKNNS